MIEQTVSLDEISKGMARAVRDHILPFLDDRMARLQAESLVRLLEGLPKAFGDDAARVIAADNERARALLERLGSPSTAEKSPIAIEGHIERNQALKRALEELVAACRQRNDEESQSQLREIRAYLVESLRAEVALFSGQTDYFASMTSREKSE